MSCGVMSYEYTHIAFGHSIVKAMSSVSITHNS